MPRSLAAKRLLPAVALVVLFASCLVAPVARGRVIAFRDAGNYYFPLFQWQCEQWAEGQIPLWNSLDGTGAPSFAETSSSVLYPGKLVFALPLPFHLRYMIYIGGHVLFAAWAALRAARGLGCSAEAAWLCAISYAFAGSILFQVHNVVFLVGAAWLPLALLAAERIAEQGSLTAALRLGAVLSMMILGGDPQMAVHAVLLATLRVCFRGDAPSISRSRSLLVIGLAALAAFCLAAVQVLPAADWTRHSERAVFDQPRNVLEAVAAVESPADLGERFVQLGGVPTPGSRYARSFDFSLPPWQFAELLWPACFGNLFPRNTQWATALPAAGRVWTPSIYLGLLPLCLCLCGLRWRRAPAAQRWLSWSLLLFAFGSLGQYGVGWLLEELRSIGGQPQAQPGGLPWPVGGLYWWMTVLIPGYAYFRYPAKLFVVATLAASLLGATSWDQLMGQATFRPAAIRRCRRLGGTLFAVAALSGIVLAVSMSPLQDSWRNWLSGATPDPLFGPVDVGQASWHLRCSLLHTIVVAVTICCVLRFRDGRRRVFLLGVTAVDLAVAQAPLIGTVPTGVLEVPAASQQVAGGETSWRFVRSEVEPPTAWATHGSSDRLSEVVRWERSSLHPKHHFAARKSLFGSRSSLTSSDMQSVARLRNTTDDFDLYANFSAKYAITFQPHDNQVRVKERSALPRAWLVESWIQLPPISSSARQVIDARTRTVFYTEDGPRDLSRVAVVETDRPLPSPPSTASDATRPGRCHLVEVGPTRLEIEIETDSPSLLVVNDLFCPGWQAAVDRDGRVQDAPVLRTNRAMRGVFVPAGSSRVLMRYRPRTFYLGAGLSVLGWSALGLYQLLRRMRPRR